MDELIMFLWVLVVAGFYFGAWAITGEGDKELEIAVAHLLKKKRKGV